MFEGMFQNQRGNGGILKSLMIFWNGHVVSMYLVIVKNNQHNCRKGVCVEI